MAEKKKTGKPFDKTVHSLPLRQGEEVYRRLFNDAVLGIFHPTLEGAFIEVNPALARMMGYDSPAQVLSSIRKRSEDKLRRSDNNLKKAEQIAKLGNWEWNISTNELIWSDEVYRIYGADPRADKPSYDIVVKTVAPECRDRFVKAVEDAVQKGAHFEGEYRLIGLDGKERFTHTIGEVVHDRDGRPVSMFGIVQDVTEHRKAEEKLRKNERQLAESQRVAKLGSWSWDVVNNALEWSEETFRRFDKDPKSFTPTVEYYVGLIHPDDRLVIQEAIRNSLENDAPYHIQPRIRNENGREWVLEGFGVVERDAAGKPLRFAGTAQDITERKAAEEKIQQSEQFIRSILDTVDEGFIVIDKDYRILTANKAYCSQVSLPSDQVIGRHCHGISHKSGRPCYETGEECAVQKVFATGEPHTALHRHQDGDGHMLFVETKGFPIHDAAGNVVSVIETINNITEKHLLEEERLKTQKLESIGTLAGGIAHDFNNLLQGIFGYISMAKMTINEKEKSLAMLEQAEKALHQSVNLTTQLLTFSKGGKPVKKLVDLRPLIEGSAKFTLSGSRSDIRMNIPEDLWLVDADGGQLGQVIQNIVLNADQAVPVGGTVVVSAANIADADALLPPGLARGDYVVIMIRDTGVGIPEQYLSRIFDPYFTTKEKGSGLGLATSYSIIRNHGGMIDVTTKSGEGTAFAIYLPASVGKVRTETAARTKETTRSRAAKILVMDDEELIRNLSGVLLRELGHDVEVAPHGQETLEKYQAALAAGQPFDLVILDLTIRGGMGGAETLRKLLEIDTGVKAIVSSGYSDDAIIAEYLSNGFKGYLKKPYNVDELRDALSILMARPAPEPG